MRPYRLAGGMVLLIAATLFGGLSAGCQNKPKANQSPPEAVAGRDTIQAIRESYQRVNPSARVGVVVRMLPESSLAAVGDIPVNEFHQGDPLTFVNANTDVIAVGSVVNVGGETLH